MVQEQKSKARILQSLLAVEDAEETERKMLEKREKAALEIEDAPDADEVTCDRLLNAINLTRRRGGK
ncbi:hypothetical protein JCGZ_22189 [Jatropha curcas]|uniref:Uncharacterized protein n=1 Tax=Jatropha curcas TaxID=180498 RepID=A0A067JW06_JATCU|nr:hypothetical protein JCGZ_22189 [Jatropha curcas]